MITVAVIFSVRLILGIEALNWPHCAFGVLQDCCSKQLGDTHQTDTIHLHYLVIHLYARDTEDSNYKGEVFKAFSQKSYALPSA